MTEPKLSSARVTGRIQVHPRGFGFVRLDAPCSDGATLAFVTPPALNAFLDGDQVCATLVASEAGRYNAVDLERVGRTRTHLFGEVTSHRGTTYLRVDREVANTDWPLDPCGLSLQPGDGVVAAIDDRGARAERKVEGNDRALARVMARYALDESFAPDVVSDVARARSVPHAIGARRDLRSLPTVTVDAPSTRDIDDAVSVLPAGPDGPLRLLVSIADASEFVTTDSPLDRAARARATSVYLAGRVLPMLPDDLSADWISLLPGRDRLCLTVELRIDPEGNVLASDVYESVIRSFARLDYTEMAAFLEHGRISANMEPVRATVAWFRTASARLGVARARRGGMLIDRDDARVTVDPGTGEPTAVERVRSNAAHTMIERFMVAANEAMASWMHTRGITAPFRVHDEPTPDRVNDLEAFAHHFGFEVGFGKRLSPLALASFDAQIEGAPAEPALRSVLRRALGPARYTVHPLPHFGLAAPLYLHFTSPIRRYADLLVHRNVKAYLHGRRDFVVDDPALETLSAHINDRAWAAGKAERERQRMLEAEWMAGHLGETFDARITRVRSFGVVAQIDSSLIEGTVPLEALPDGPYQIDERETAASGPKGSFEIGMPLRVRAVRTDAALGRIEFALVGGG